MGERSHTNSGSPAGWELKESEVRFQGKMFRIREDRFLLPGGEPHTYQFEERSPGVVIVPVTRAGEIILIRQYRHPVGDWCLEVPAGGCHDTGDASCEEVAAKELREEVGAEAERFELLGSFYTAPSFADERCHVLIAWETRTVGAPRREKGESIEIRIVPANEAFHLARTGGIQTSVAIIALLWAEARLRT